MSIIKKRPEKRSIDLFRVITLAIALAVATLPLTLSDATISRFTVSKYLQNDIAGDDFYVVRQGTMITVKCGNGTQNNDKSYPPEGDYEQYTLAGGYWGIYIRGWDGKQTESKNSAGAGGSARGMIYIPGNSGTIYLSSAQARGGDGSGSAQNGTDGGAGGNALVVRLTSSTGDILACAGGGGGTGDDYSDCNSWYMNGGAGGHATSNAGAAGGNAGADPGSGNPNSGGVYNGTLSRGGNSNRTGGGAGNADAGAGGGGIGGGNGGASSGGSGANRGNSKSGGGGGASWVQDSLPAAGGTFNYQGTLNTTTGGAAGTCQLIYFGEFKPVTSNTW